MSHGVAVSSNNGKSWEFINKQLPTKAGIKKLKSNAIEFEGKKYLSVSHGAEPKLISEKTDPFTSQIVYFKEKLYAHNNYELFTLNIDNSWTKQTNLPNKIWSLTSSDNSLIVFSAMNENEETMNDHENIILITSPGSIFSALGVNGKTLYGFAIPSDFSTHIDETTNYLDETIGKFVKSLDGGKTWKEIPLKSNSFVESLTIAKDTLIAVNNNHQLLSLKI